MLFADFMLLRLWLKRAMPFVDIADVSWRPHPTPPVSLSSHPGFNSSVPSVSLHGERTGRATQRWAEHNGARITIYHIEVSKQRSAVAVRSCVSCSCGARIQLTIQWLISRSVGPIGCVVEERRISRARSQPWLGRTLVLHAAMQRLFFDFIRSLCCLVHMYLLSALRAALYLTVTETNSVSWNHPYLLLWRGTYLQHHHLHTTCLWLVFRRKHWNIA